MQTNNANLLSKSTVVVEIRTSVATVIAGVLIFFFSIPPSVQAAGGLICDVDLSPPLITVTTPQRAEFIESSSDSVAVTGMASDVLSPITSITVNGQELLPGGGGMTEPFSTNITAPWGLTIIEVVVTDDCGNQSKSVQSIIRSDSYYAAATTPDLAAKIQNGFISHFNQPSIDDQIRESIDDMATATQLILDNVDYESVINDALPVVVVQDLSAANRSCSGLFDFWTQLYYKVTRSDVAISSIIVNSIEARDTFIQSVTSSSEIDVPLNINFRQYTCTAGALSIFPNTNVPGIVTVQDANIVTNIGVSVVNEELDLSVLGVNAGASDIDVQIQCPSPFGILCSSLVNFISNFAINILLDQFGTNISASLLGTTSQYLDAYTPPITFVLPAPISASLAIDLAVDTASVSGPPGSGFLSIEYGHQTIPGERGSTISASAPGAARHDGAPLLFSNSGFDLGFGLKDDVLNQSMWALWYLGGFEALDLMTLLNVSGAPVDTISLGFNLPPLLMPDGTPNGVSVGLGDVSIEAVVDLEEVLGPPFTGLVTVEIFASAMFSGTLGFNAASQSLNLDVSSVDVFTQTVSTTGVPAVADAVRIAVEQGFSAIGTSLIESLIGSIRLPVVDLTGLAPGIFPGNQVVGLVGVQLDRPNDVAARLTGFTAFDNDTDGDGVLDTGDNCTEVPNLTQGDVDGDGFGNICDPDLNNDGIVNFLDVFLFSQAFGSVGAQAADLNGDGVVNFLDYAILPGFFGGPPGPSGISLAPN